MGKGKDKDKAKAKDKDKGKGKDKDKGKGKGKYSQSQSETCQRSQTTSCCRTCAHCARPREAPWHPLASSPVTFLSSSSQLGPIVSDRRMAPPCQKRHGGASCSSSLPLRDICRRPLRPSHPSSPSSSGRCAQLQKNDQIRVQSRSRILNLFSLRRDRRSSHLETERRRLRAIRHAISMLWCFTFKKSIKRPH